MLPPGKAAWRLTGSGSSQDIGPTEAQAIDKGGPVKSVTIIHRRLREGKTFDDHRKAWFHTTGFGAPTTMYTVVNAFDPGS